MSLSFHKIKSCRWKTSSYYSLAIRTLPKYRNSRRAAKDTRGAVVPPNLKRIVKVNEGIFSLHCFTALRFHSTTVSQRFARSRNHQHRATATA